MIGQTITADGNCFEIVKLLGKGKGGYSYLAESNAAEYVFKKIHYEPCAYFQFESNKLAGELRDYRKLSDMGITVPRLLYSDQEEQYLIKEYIEGDLLSECAADNRISDDHIRQMFEMCNILYKNNLNIDYFPTNFVVRQGVVYYIDYECSIYSDEWNFENWGIYFYANAAGMAEYIKTAGDAGLIENGKPIRRGLEEIVERWKNIFHSA